MVQLVNPQPEDFRQLFTNCLRELERHKGEADFGRHLENYLIWVSEIEIAYRKVFN